ncbi:hypothetical protein D3C80_2200020 [compost metagenome]
MAGGHTGYQRQLDGREGVLGPMQGKLGQVAGVGAHRVVGCRLRIIRQGCTAHPLAGDAVNAHGLLSG